MKQINLLLLTLVVGAISNGYTQGIENFLRPYADAIIKETAFELSDRQSGKTFSFSSADHPEPVQDLSIESGYLHWRYTNALVYDGLRELGKLLDEEKYIAFGKQAFAFFFDNKQYYEKARTHGYTIDGLENFVRFKGVWNDGAQTAALVNVYMDAPRADYMEYMERVADYFFDYATNGSENQGSLNIDQIYAKGVFMARMGRLTGEQRYYDYCVEEVLKTKRQFLDPATGLYNQYHYPELGVTNNIKWLRGIGWAAMGIVNILAEIPQDHPGYEKILGIFRNMVIAVSSYQTKTGLWRHLVDRQDCFEETSGSTYLVYAIAKGINSGYLDPMYRDVAMAGWHGIVAMQDEDGNFKNVTPGVSGSTSPTYYYGNAFDESASHLYGPLFLAGAEMLQLYKEYDKPKVRDWKLTGP